MKGLFIALNAFEPSMKSIWNGYEDLWKTMRRPFKHLYEKRRNTKKKTWKAFETSKAYDKTYEERQEYCYFTPEPEAGLLGGRLDIPTLNIIGSKDV